MSLSQSGASLSRDMPPAPIWSYMLPPLPRPAKNTIDITTDSATVPNTTIGKMLCI